MASNLLTAALAGDTGPPTIVATPPPISTVTTAAQRYRGFIRVGVSLVRDFFESTT